MTEQIIEITASSLDEARNRLKSQIPEGFYIVSETIISDGWPKTVKTLADTIEIAFAKAQDEIPSNAEVLEKKESYLPKQTTIMIKAFDEPTATALAEAQAVRQLGGTTMVKNIKLVTLGKKGFLGIGKKPNQYEAEIFRQALVEISYKEDAKISVTTVDAETLAERRRREAEEARQREEQEEYEERVRHLRGLYDDESAMH